MPIDLSVAYDVSACLWMTASILPASPYSAPSSSGLPRLACNTPGQWGQRRLALGACACTSAVAALLLVPSVWWWGAIVWGLHQMYLGWTFISRRRRTTHERLAYLESSVAVLAYIALADGHVNAREASIIVNIYARAGFPAEDVRLVGRIVQECEQRFFADGSDPDRLFVLLHLACAVVLEHSNEHTRVSFLRTAILIAASDGFVSAAEDNVLRAMASWLHISALDAAEAWRTVSSHETGGSHSEDAASWDEQSTDSGQAWEEPTVPPDLATYYASILGVAVTASAQEIKQAYRDKAKQYHPDVVTHMGAEFAREAEERFKELSKAYEFFRRHNRGDIVRCLNASHRGNGQLRTISAISFCAKSRPSALSATALLQRLAPLVSHLTAAPPTIRDLQQLTATSSQKAKNSSGARRLGRHDQYFRPKLLDAC